MWTMLAGSASWNQGVASNSTVRESSAVGQFAWIIGVSPCADRLRTVPRAAARPGSAKRPAPDYAGFLEGNSDPGRHSLEANGTQGKVSASLRDPSPCLSLPILTRLAEPAPKSSVIGWRGQFRRAPAGCVRWSQLGRPHERDHHYTRRPGPSEARAAALVQGHPA